MLIGAIQSVLFSIFDFFDAPLPPPRSVSWVEKPFTAKFEPNWENLIRVSREKFSWEHWLLEFEIIRYLEPFYLSLKVIFLFELRFQWSMNLFQGYFPLNPSGSMGGPDFQLLQFLLIFDFFFTSIVRFFGFLNLFRGLLLSSPTLLRPHYRLNVSYCDDSSFHIVYIEPGFCWLLN